MLLHITIFIKLLKEHLRQNYLQTCLKNYCLQIGSDDFWYSTKFQLPLKDISCLTFNNLLLFVKLSSQIIEQVLIIMIQTIQTATLAAIDLCLHISSIKNHASYFTECYEIQISFMTADTMIVAFPYQVLSKKQNAHSQVTLETYKSQKFIGPPKKSVQINQICIFRLLISLQEALYGSLVGRVKLLHQGNMLRETRIDLASVLSINSFLPIFFPFESVSVDATIQSQLLGIKCKKNTTLPRSSFYSVIDTLFWEHQKLGKKVGQYEDRKKEIESETSIALEEKPSSMTTEHQSNPEFPSLRNPQLTRYQSIFHRDPSKDKQKIESLEFLCHQASNNLQIDWKEYISKKINNFAPEHHRKLKKGFFQELLYEHTKIGRNINEENLFTNIAAQQILINYDFNVEKRELALTDKSFDSNYRDIQIKTNHLIVLVHGLGANSSALVLYERIINHLFPQATVFLSRANQLNTELRSLEEMGRSLATELQLYLHNKNSENLQISFIAHSLGGLIVRAALFHLEAYRFNMQTFISLSCPHFGHLKHTNKVTKIGMVAANKIWHSSVFDCLLFKDSPQIRTCYLYKLAFHPGLLWFQNIHFYGCKNDGYVSSHSALYQVPPSKLNPKQKESDKALVQMQNFLKDNMTETKVEKYLIDFDLQEREEEKLYEKILGRGPHLAFLTNINFIQYTLLNTFKVFNIPEEKERDQQ